MLHPFLWTLIRVVVASLILGAVLAHFGITAEQLMLKTGLTPERLEEYARRGFDWAWPNALLGSLVIVPLWFLIVLFRPPPQRRSD
jgi:hypothetical protein